MDEAGIGTWYRSYLAVFASLGRGERDDVEALLEYWGAPLMFSTGAGTTHLLDEGAVLAAGRQQIDALRAAGYDRSEPLGLPDVEMLNASCARLRGRFARVRRDGSTIAEIDVTYLITADAGRTRMAALILA